MSDPSSLSNLLARQKLSWTAKNKNWRGFRQESSLSNLIIIPRKSILKRVWACPVPLFLATSDLSWTSRQAGRTQYPCGSQPSYTPLTSRTETPQAGRAS
jgi:hypothetical protein